MQQMQMRQTRAWRERVDIMLAGCEAGPVPRPASAYTVSSGADSWLWLVSYSGLAALAGSTSCGSLGVVHVGGWVGVGMGRKRGVSLCVSSQLPLCLPVRPADEHGSF